MPIRAEPLWQPFPGAPSRMPTQAPDVRDAADLRGAARQRLLWSYGIGDAGTGMTASLIGSYLFVFYTSAAGLPSWLRADSKSQQGLAAGWRLAIASSAVMS